MNAVPAQLVPSSDFPVIVVGGGQAGLSISWYLCKAGIRHAVFEARTPCHSWKEERWDSFCLVTPNWQCGLPGYPYQGDDPHGFMVKEQIVEYLRDFVRSFSPPVYSGVEVTRLAEKPEGGYLVKTNKGDFSANQVVIASGGYRDPIIPPYASALSSDILQLHSSNYRNPADLPEGAVMVVGSGQSGAQIAEDLHLAGRKVHLCVGPAPRVSRFYRGKDVVDWLALMGYYDLPVDKHPLGESVREKTNHYVTGRDGGRDIDLRRFAAEGMRLNGSLAGIKNGIASFKPDLEANLDDADATNERIKQSIDAYIAKQGIDAPTEPPYAPVWRPTAPALSADLMAEGITSVIWSIGLRPNYRWIDVPVFDGAGRPAHNRGVTRQPGLYFLGLPWLYTWGSGRFSGIARDAEYLAGLIQSGPRAACQEAA